MKKLVFITLLLGSLAHAETSLETWTVDGKTFTAKAQAIRYIVASGKRMDVVHTQCQQLTNKLTFKSCPKNKATSFENEQFTSIKESQ